MLTIMRQRVRAYMSQRVYSLLGIFFLLLSLTLTTHAMLTVSNSGLSGDADVSVDGLGALNIGTASSTGVVIGKAGAPVTLQGPTAINGALTLGVASTTAGQLLFNNASNSFTTLLRSSSSQASNLAFTLPNTAGTSGQAMLTDGAGDLYFGTGSSTGVSQAALDLKAPLASPTFTGNVTVGNTVLGLPGGVGDDVADDTAALQAWLTNNATTGGHLIIPSGKLYKISGTISVPYNASSPFAMPTFRISGPGPVIVDGDQVPTSLPNPSGLDLQYAGNRLVSLGQGSLVLDNITLLNNSPNCGTFVYSTLTNVSLTNVAIYGSTSNVGLSACEYGWIAGGKNHADGTLQATVDQYFQGYGSSVNNLFADRLKVAILGQSAFNSIPIKGVRLWKGCGNGDTAPITSATNANPAVLTMTTPHGFTVGTTVQLNLSGFTGSWTPVNGHFTATILSATTVSVPVNSTAFGAMAGTPVYLDGGGIIINGAATGFPNDLAYGDTIEASFAEMAYYPHFIKLISTTSMDLKSNSCFDSSAYDTTCYALGNRTYNTKVSVAYVAEAPYSAVVTSGDNNQQIIGVPLDPGAPMAIGNPVTIAQGTAQYGTVINSLASSAYGSQISLVANSDTTPLAGSWQIDTGGNMVFTGSSGGSLYFRAVGTKAINVGDNAANPISIGAGGGTVKIKGIPTSCSGLTTGYLWNNAGTLAICP